MPEKLYNCTGMFNHHIYNEMLLLKSKELLSMTLSLPKDWNYATRCLAKICKEITYIISSALKELEQAEYIIRN